MTTTRDPHNALWTPDDRNPVTLAQIGRVPPGLRYGLRALVLSGDGRGAHMAQRMRLSRMKTRKNNCGFAAET